MRVGVDERSCYGCMLIIPKLIKLLIYNFHRAEVLPRPTSEANDISEFRRMICWLILSPSVEI